VLYSVRLLDVKLYPKKILKRMNIKLHGKVSRVSFCDKKYVVTIVTAVLVCEEKELVWWIKVFHTESQSVDHRKSRTERARSRRNVVLEEDAED
jgi:hypothetical protein